MRQRGVFPLFVDQNVCGLIVEVHFSGAGFITGSCSSSAASAHGEPAPLQSVVHTFVLPEAGQERPEGLAVVELHLGSELSLLRGRRPSRCDVTYS